MIFLNKNKKISEKSKAKPADQWKEEKNPGNKGTKPDGVQSGEKIAGSKRRRRPACADPKQKRQFRTPHEGAISSGTATRSRPVLAGTIARPAYYFSEYSGENSEDTLPGYTDFSGRARRADPRAAASRHPASSRVRRAPVGEQAVLVERAGAAQLS